MKEARRQKGRSQKTEVRRQKSGDRSRARGRYSDFRGRPTSSAVAAPSVPGAGLFPTLAPSQQHSWRQQKTVSHIARVNVQSHDGSSLVDALGESSLSGAVPCARDIECSYRATGSAYKAVIHIACVNVVSRDGRGPVEGNRVGALTGAVARARSTEADHRAMGGAKQAVTRIARVDIIPRDGSCPVVAEGKGSLVGASPGARGIEHGDSATGSAHEAVTRQQSPPGSSRRPGGYSPVLRLTADEMRLPLFPCPQKFTFWDTTLLPRGTFWVRSAPGPLADAPRPVFLLLACCTQEEDALAMEWARARARMLDFVSILRAWHREGTTTASELPKAA